MPMPAATHTAGSVARYKLMLMVGIEPRTADLAVEHCMHCATLAFFYEFASFSMCTRELASKKKLIGAFF